MTQFSCKLYTCFRTASKTKRRSFPRMKIPPYEPDRVFKRDELILAKWADCRLYFATVLSRIDESKCPDKLLF